MVVSYLKIGLETTTTHTSNNKDKFILFLIIPKYTKSLLLAFPLAIPLLALSFLSPLLLFIFVLCSLHLIGDLPVIPPQPGYLLCSILVAVDPSGIPHKLLLVGSAQDTVTVLYEIITTFVSFFLHQIEQPKGVCDVYG